MAGDVIIGSFYNEELQKAYVTDDKVYKIEKVLKKRTYRGVKQIYVKWLYYPRKCNSWVDASSVEKINPECVNIVTVWTDTTHLYGYTALFCQ